MPARRFWVYPGISSQSDMSGWSPTTDVHTYSEMLKPPQQNLFEAKDGSLKCDGTPEIKFICRTINVVSSILCTYALHFSISSSSAACVLQQELYSAETCKNNQYHKGFSNVMDSGNLPAI